ncbi:MAG: hypothetical protein ACYC8T_22255 [Myxococcaceae bacterium]
MIRHPVLVVFQLACAFAIAAVGHFTQAAGRERSEAPLTFALSVLGETETPEGGWEGADLLVDPGQRAERFQFTVRADRRARVTLDVVEDGQVRRIFPAVGQEGVLTPGRFYALPGPSAFYELDGEAHLRLTVSLPDGTPTPTPAAAVGRFAQVRYPLSDGAKHPTSQRLFRAAGAGTLDFDLHR